MGTCTKNENNSWDNDLKKITNMNYQYKSDFIDIVDFFKNTGIYTYKLWKYITTGLKISKKDLTQKITLKTF